LGFEKLGEKVGENSGESVYEKCVESNPEFEVIGTSKFHFQKHPRTLSLKAQPPLQQA
jgi:hypothetical protein